MKKLYLLGVAALLLAACGGANNAPAKSNTGGNKAPATDNSTAENPCGNNTPATVAIVYEIGIDGMT